MQYEKYTLEFQVKHVNAFDGFQTAPVTDEFH